MTDPTTTFIWLFIILMALIAITILIVLAWLKKWISNKPAERWEIKSDDSTLPPPEPLTVIEHTQNKTLWDIAQILVVPLLLAALSPYLTNLVNINNQSISLDQQRETILDSYVNDISNLLLKNDIKINLHDSKNPYDEVRQVADARTQTTLQQLDPERRGFVILFLYRTNLLNRENVLVTLHQANIRNADLSGVYLDDCSLHDAFLNNADLHNSVLSNADVSFSDLNGANLEGTNFSHAFLYDLGAYHADLKGTKFVDADLRKANFYDTDLTGAKFDGANLAGANLRDAKTRANQFKNAYSLKGATMPDGSVHG